MAVKASATITISAYRDTSSITRYYKLQASSLATPSKPTTNPPSGWTDAEPAYSSSSTNTLYFCDLMVFSDGTWQYTTVSKSSSYEAAKEAYNKATAAQEDIDNLDIGGRNYVLCGKGGTKDGIFKSFTTAGDDYCEHTLTSKKQYSNVNIKQGFVLSCREYEVGKAVTWSYDLMYTAWNFPEGSNRTEFWFGQRYTNAPSGETATGTWRGVTQHNLPVVGVNGCELNEWYHVEKTLIIPEQASSNVNEAASIQFYNSNADVEASITFRIKNVKLEYGNRATDWTPAPEDVDAEISEAAKTATNFMSYDSTNGLVIGNKTSGSWSGYRSQVLPSAFNILDASGNILSSFGTTTTIGPTSGNHTLIDDTSFNIKDGSKLLASYGDVINLYNDEREALTIDKSDFIESYVSTGGANHAYYQYILTSSTSTVINTTISKSVSSSTLFMVHIYYNGSGIANISRNRYILFYPSITATSFTFKWDPTTPAYVIINGSTKQPCFHCDSNATTDMIINGSLWINNTSDINGLVPGMAPLGIGTKEKSRLELDYNEVMAMDKDGPAHLYLNMEGGNVSVNNNCTFGTLFGGDLISFKCRSVSEDNWFNAISTAYSNSELVLNVGSGYRSSDYSTRTDVSGNEIRFKVLGSSDTCRFMSNSSSEFMIADKNGRSVLIPLTAAGNVALGYGGYAASDGYTNIYGNNIKLFTKGNVYTDCLRLNTNGSGITGLDSSGNAVNMIFVGSTDILNVGGGSATPQYAHVTSKLRTRLATTNGGVQIADGEGSTTYDGYFHPTTDNKVSCGKTTHRWTRVYAANSSISTSDKRLKKNIKPLETSLYSRLFDKLQPCEYEFIEGEQRVNFGLIAQDVLESMAELGIAEDELDLVHHDIEKDDETGKEVESFGLAYENLIALLISEVQHLKSVVMEMQKTK